MVQIYNPNVVGKQILIDVKNIDSNKLKLVEHIKPFMNLLIDELKLNVVGECLHQFKKDDEPYGVTMVYLLSESHLSIHSFQEKNYTFIDIFSCKDFDVDKAVEYTLELFKPTSYTKNIVERGIDFPR